MKIVNIEPMLADSVLRQATSFHSDHVEVLDETSKSQTLQQLSVGLSSLSVFGTAIRKRMTLCLLDEGFDLVTAASHAKKLSHLLSVVFLNADSSTDRESGLYGDNKSGEASTSDNYTRIVLAITPEVVSLVARTLNDPSIHTVAFANEIDATEVRRLRLLAFARFAFRISDFAFEGDLSRMSLCGISDALLDWVHVSRERLAAQANRQEQAV